MHPLEIAIIQTIRSAFSEYRAAIDSQFHGITTSKPNYTGGGGFFLSLHVAPTAVPLPESFLTTFSALEGPTISSPELENGASSRVHVGADGYFNSLEISSFAGDYPHDRHPKEFTFSRPIGTIVDLNTPEKD